MSKNPLDALPGNLNSLGDYLREQRLTKKLSVRQLSALAGVSNPYLSQIERGVKRPSAEILQQIAKGLSISAETLYVQAGLLDPKEAAGEAGATTRAAIAADPALTSRQRQTLIDIYESFAGTPSTGGPAASTQAPATTKGAKAGTTKAAPKKAAKKTAAKKTTAKKSSADRTKSSAASASSTQTTSTSRRNS
ncbi:MAG: helix-turn-helix domain-containing protein [Janibacter sp.]